MPDVEAKGQAEELYVHLQVIEREGPTGKMRSNP